MSRIPEGRAPLSVVEWITEEGAHNGHGFELQGSNWDAVNVEPEFGMEWSAEPDSDEPEIALSLRAYAALVSRARAHCEGCSEGCTRNG